MIHVGLDAQLLSAAASYRAAGVSKYSLHLLRTLQQTAAEKNVRFTAFIPAASHRLFAPQPAKMTLEATRLPVQNALVRIAWEQLWLPRRLAHTQVDLIHGLVNVLPMATSKPGVVTVHDLSFLRMPEVLPSLKRRYLAALCRASVHKAAHVIAVSRQTADDLMHYFGLPSSKISVIDNGVDERFRPAAQAQVEAFGKHKKLPERFLLYVGTLEPRKNLPLLIRAFAHWRSGAGRRDQDVKLVLAGAKGWFYEQIFAEVSRLHLEEHVLFPGYLPEEELPSWYQAAHAFVYPTLFEGFGLPVLEAMACGVPVICSQASSLLEIVDEQALTHAAEDAEGLARQIGRLIEEPALRAALVEGGLARAALLEAYGGGDAGNLPGRLSQIF